MRWELMIRGAVYPEEPQSCGSEEPDLPHLSAQNT
jgi:hypothetical protein